MSRALRFPALFVLFVLASVPFALDASSAGHPAPAAGARTLEDYRHFRITAIDLLGRMPTRDEIAAFERSDFDFDAWIDRQLGGPPYVERLSRVYMDALRLEPNLNFQSAPSQLYRHDVLGPDCKPIAVYYRENQRRRRPETDGEFCLSPSETGVVIRARAQDAGTPIKVSQKLLDAYTVKVRPWWLYRDYQSAAPTQRYGEGWKDVDAQFQPVDALLTDDGKPDGKPTVEVRVCREEASALETGPIYVTGRTKASPKDAKLPGGRTRPAPLDKPYATQHPGQDVACDSKLGLDYAPDCGCGVGLDRCLPGDRNDQGAAAFSFPNHLPLGPDLPLDDARQQAQRWFPYWWSREVTRFLGDLFGADRDFREILTGRQTFVNGPLAQFYRTIQRGSCCGPETSFGMIEESEPLFDPKNVPADLAPSDASTWKRVDDRGPHAAGLLTMPMFLEKYASARARAAAVYNDFLCKSFVAENQQLTPSTEPNLMVRPGCQTCHATLEPLAAYFARVEASNFVFLPPSLFPVHTTACRLDKNGRLNGNCNALYDAAFADGKGATLRSAYGSPEHADEMPTGAARDLTQKPEFAQCAAQRVTSSFLGRALTPDDDALLASLTGTFVRSGYRMKALVGAIVRSDAYRRSNNLSSTSWRAGSAP